MQRVVGNAIGDPEIQFPRVRLQRRKQGIEGGFRIVRRAGEHAVCLLHPPEEKGIRKQRWLQSAFRH